MIQSVIILIAALVLVALQYTAGGYNCSERIQNLFQINSLSIKSIWQELLI